VRYDDFGRVFGRAGLSLIEREAIVIGVLIAHGAPQISSHHRAMLQVGGNEASIDALVEAVAAIVDAKTVAAARQYIAAVRKQ
jgi:alkylhydroperoxidase/carboxymuconolactone decarboxylase family protein YurZ